MSEQRASPSTTPDQDAVSDALMTLRTGTKAEKLLARERLARIFEQRDLLDEAADCYETNILEGVRDPLLYERLASIYDRQGDTERADLARTEARKLIERAQKRPGPGESPRAVPPGVTSTEVGSPVSGLGVNPSLSDTTRVMHGPPFAARPPSMAAQPGTRLTLPIILTGAGVLLLTGVALVTAAAITHVTPPPASAPTPVAQYVEPTVEPVRADPTVAALIEQIASIEATAQAVRAPGAPTPTPIPSIRGSGNAPAGIEALRSVAAFVVTDSGSGSGVSMGGGRFVTNYHVIEDADTVMVRLVDGRSARAEVRSVDPARDLALLETPLKDLQAAKLRDSRDLQSAENLYVVGYPMGTRLGVEDVTVTRGIFSARRQARNSVWHVQTDAPMNPGNSGGPVGDSDGNVIGIATMGMRGTDGLNFAVASDEVRAFLDGGGVAPAPRQAAAPSVPSAPSRPSAPAPAPVVSARPELLSASFGPSSVAPGEAIIVSFEVANAGNVPVPVVLGSSIRLGSGPWIDDPSNDAKLRVAPGRSTVTRQVRVPPSASPGRYDLWVTLLSEDMKSNYGQRSATGSLNVALRTAAPVEPPPVVARAPGASSPGPAAATPRPPNALPGFDPSRYIGQGNKYDCADFLSQAQAQAVLRADPSDPNLIDGDKNGVACENSAAPRDEVPVRRR